MTVEAARQLLTLYSVCFCRIKRRLTKPPSNSGGRAVFTKQRKRLSHWPNRGCRIKRFSLTRPGRKCSITLQSKWVLIAAFELCLLAASVCCYFWQRFKAQVIQSLPIYLKFCLDCCEEDDAAACLAAFHSKFHSKSCVSSLILSDSDALWLWIDSDWQYPYTISVCATIDTWMGDLLQCYIIIYMCLWTLTDGNLCSVTHKKGVSSSAERAQTHFMNR